VRSKGRLEEIGAGRGWLYGRGGYGGDGGAFCDEEANRAGYEKESDVSHTAAMEHMPCHAELAPKRGFFCVGRR
jgi:hypothetical protein